MNTKTVRKIDQYSGWFLIKKSIYIPSNKKSPTRQKKTIFIYKLPIYFAMNPFFGITSGPIYFYLQKSVPNADRVSAGTCRQCPLFRNEITHPPLRRENGAAYAQTLLLFINKAARLFTNGLPLALLCTFSTGPARYEKALRL